MTQFIYCHLLSEMFPHREERLRAGAGKCVTLHKYVTATTSLNNAWVASMITQHGDQLCLIFITVYAEEALATSQLKLFLHLISSDTGDPPCYLCFRVPDLLLQILLLCSQLPQQVIQIEHVLVFLWGPWLEADKVSEKQQHSLGAQDQVLCWQKLAQSCYSQ